MNALPTQTAENFLAASVADQMRRDIVAHADEALIDTKCRPCKTPLFRVTESEANDRVICPSCFASGGYKEVVEQGAGLMKVPVADEIMKFIEERWIATKLGR